MMLLPSVTHNCENCNFYSAVPRKERGEYTPIMIRYHFDHPVIYLSRERFVLVFFAKNEQVHASGEEFCN